MQKRMRATVPTAEEAMAFLLPHLLEFRRLYLEAHQRANSLENEVGELRRGYENVVTLSQEKIRFLQRQLELTRYRLALLGPKPSGV